MVDIWGLDPKLNHLNHGGFGAAPLPVLEEQGMWRERMEANPTGFMTSELGPHLDGVREELGSFVGADAEGFILIHNATTGVNAVATHLELDPGDRIVTTSHDYNACRGALQHAADRAGAEVVVVDVPFPIGSADVAVESVLHAVDDRTKLVMVDHVTSPTGLVLPLDRIVSALESRAIPVLIDGAHAPGMVPVDIDALGVSYYAANCHKWMCAPKGAAFLWVAPRHRETFTPPVVSHGWNTGERARFRRLADWMGTDDPTAWLSIPRAIEVMAGLHPKGWEGVRRANRELVLEARKLITGLLEIDSPAPEGMIGSLAAVPIPDDSGPAPILGPNDATPLMRRMFDEYRIVVPVPIWPRWPHRLIRISAQRYNHIADYEQLVEALGEVLDGVGP